MKAAYYLFMSVFYLIFGIVFHLAALPVWLGILFLIPLFISQMLFIFDSTDSKVDELEQKLKEQQKEIEALTKSIKLLIEEGGNDYDRV